MTCDRTSYRSYPEQQVGAVIVASFAGERVSNVGNDVSLRSEICQVGRDRRQLRSRRIHAGGKCSERIGELVPRHGQRAVARPATRWRHPERAEARRLSQPCAARPRAPRSVHSRQALASVIRWPARLPLSTVET